MDSIAKGDEVLTNGGLVGLPSDQSSGSRLHCYRAECDTTEVVIVNVTS